MYLKSLVALATVFSVQTATAQEKRLILTKENVVTMNQAFDSETVAKLTQQVRDLDSQLKSNEPIYIVMNTPGGSIDDGIELIENLSNMNRPIHTLSLFSASMGFHAVQGLGKRFITANGTLMSHKARGGFSGEFPGQLDSRYSYYLRRIQNLDKKVVARTKGKLTTKSYATLIENEYWCDGQDCIDKGFADAVVRPTCNKSLGGTKNEDIKLHMGPLTITVRLVIAACPLTTGIISYDVFVDGEQLFKDPGTATYYSAKFSEKELNGVMDKVSELIETRTSKKNVKRY